MSVSPKHWVYVLCHALLIVIGFAICAQLKTDSVWFSVGASIAAAGLAGFVVFVHVLVSDRMEKQLNVISSFGIIDAFDSRSVTIRDEYEKRLLRAREKIDVMGYGLRAFREDFHSKMSDLRKRAEIRVLLIDPEYPSVQFSFATQRSREEHGNDIAGDVRAFVTEMEDVIRRNRKDLRVRLYRCLPSVNIFRIDDEMFWGPYLINQQSRNAPTFVVRRGGLLFPRFMQHFDAIWNSDELSRDVPMEWLREAAE